MAASKSVSENVPHKTQFHWPYIPKARGEMTSGKTVNGLLPSIWYTMIPSAVTCVFVNGGCEESSNQFPLHPQLFVCLLSEVTHRSQKIQE